MTGAEACIAGPDGRVLGLAIDHVGSLDAVLAGGDPSAFKADVVAALGGLATTVLVDEGHHHLLASAPDAVPMLGLDDDDPPATVARLVAVGACVVKAHLFCDGPVTAAQEARVAAWGEACAAEHVPFLFEPLVAAIGDRSDAVAAVATTFAHERFGVSVLKLQLPIDDRVDATSSDHRRAQALLADAAGTVPFVFLSGGLATAEGFDRLLVAAGEAGTVARGVVVGRAVWGEAAATPPARRGNALDRAAIRFRTLADLVTDVFPASAPAVGLLHDRDGGPR